ncbi:MAG TPA: helix-turn-helix transcriptional regulator [Saprospiraceae bacterium]|nr:helix-turn-helix transcriptional regulator [Saprospiraceae bacterium]
MNAKEVLFRIREQREKMHLTQQAIATELDLETKSYSNIENGVTELSISRFLKIAEILITPPEYFINPMQNFNFKDCNQSGYLNHPIFQKESKEFLEDMINGKMVHLEEEISFLRKMLDKSITDKTM